MRNAFFTGGKDQGKIASSLYLLLVWWLGFLVFIQAMQVQFLGRELQSCFIPWLTSASLRSVWNVRRPVDHIDQWFSRDIVMSGDIFE